MRRPPGRRSSVPAKTVIGMFVQHSLDGDKTLYFHQDHLGSISTITNHNGAVIERLSYDPWGKRRNPDGTDDTAGTQTSQASRGFTGHEMLDGLDLVHMNGRVYDPIIGRFGSADPITEAPFTTQGWNRYAYVGNSPVNFTDPSGYCFLGCFWKKIGKALGKLLRKFPIIGTILRIAAVALCAGNIACGALVSFATSAAITGLTGGSLGQALKSGLIAAGTVIAFHVGAEMLGFAGGAGGVGYETETVASSTRSFSGMSPSYLHGPIPSPGALSSAMSDLPAGLPTTGLATVNSTTTIIHNTVQYAPVAHSAVLSSSEFIGAMHLGGALAGSLAVDHVSWRSFIRRGGTNGAGARLTNPGPGYRWAGQGYRPDPPSSLQRPQWHHDAPGKFAKDFERSGLKDWNAHRYVRWVEGGPAGGHQRWSYDFNRMWADFFRSNPNPGQDAIIRQLEHMRRLPGFQ